MIDVETDEERNCRLYEEAANGNLGVIAELCNKLYLKATRMAGMVVFPVTEVGRVLNGLQRLCETECLITSRWTAFTLEHLTAILSSRFLWSWVLVIIDS